MARGFLVGNFVDNTTGLPLPLLEVGLTNLRGADVNGRNINFDVPQAEITRGILGPRRLTDALGIFKIPFTWPVTPDNLARVAGQDLLDVDLIAFQGLASKSFKGTAAKIPDALQIIEVIKSGQLLLVGSSKDVLDKLTPLLKNSLDPKDLSAIPFTMLSTDLIMIFGVFVNVRY
jgi:hypothetical protein